MRAACVGLDWLAIWALLFDKLASASRPKGVSELSGNECSLGDPGKKSSADPSTCGGGDGEFNNACVCAVWLAAEGEGDRETIPEAKALIPGLLMDRKTVSNVRSILRRERVSNSCFLCVCFMLEMKDIDHDGLTLKISCHDLILQICTHCSPFDSAGMGDPAQLLRTSSSGGGTPYTP